MSFSEVSLLFLVQMAFGSMLTFAVNDREALGPKYFKFSGWVLVALYGLAVSLRSAEVTGGAVDTAAAAGATASAAASSLDGPLAWGLVGCTLGMLAFSSVSGWDRPGLESAVLWLTILLGGGVVAASSLAIAPADLDATGQALTVAGAFGSALVLGFVTWGMILGHWYLVSKDLAIVHLGKLVAPLPWIFLFKTVVSALALWLLWDRVLGPGMRDLDDVMNRQPERVLDIVNVWARIPVGLLVPAVMAFMTKVTVRMEKTQPATGILYAMCTTVYLGDLMGKMVEGGTGVPL